MHEELKLQQQKQRLEILATLIETQVVEKVYLSATQSNDEVLLTPDKDNDIEQVSPGPSDGCYNNPSTATKDAEIQSWIDIINTTTALNPNAKPFKYQLSGNSKKIGFSQAKYNNVNLLLLFNWLKLR